MSEVLQEHIGEVHEGKKPFQSEAIHLILMRNIQIFAKSSKWVAYPSSTIGKKPFLTKIQNRISEKTRKKIVLLSCKKFVQTQFLGVAEFPSIF